MYINIKLFFECWMVPKTTVTTVTVTLEKKFEKNRKKIHKCLHISEKSRNFVP
jgi:hypothetical protein